MAVEQSEEWLTGRRYLDMRELEQPWHQERETKEVALEERMKMIDGHVGNSLFCSKSSRDFFGRGTTMPEQPGITEPEQRYSGGWRLARR